MGYNASERHVVITSVIITDRARKQIRRVQATMFAFNESEIRSLLSKKFKGKELFIGSVEYHKPLFFHSLLKNDTEKARILLLEDESLI